MTRKVCVSFDQDLCSLVDTEKLKVTQVLPVQMLAQTIQTIDAVGLEARGVLGPQDYQLIRAKKPAVPEASMKEALLWQEQAHFAVPPHQLVLAYRECRVMSGPAVVYVIAVSKPVLQSRYDVLQGAGLLVKNLTIPEFVYAEYIQAKHPDMNLVVWVHAAHDKARGFAYLNGDLVATMRLPSMNVAEQARSLMQFYESQLKGFDQEPLWLLHCEAPMQDISLIGTVNPVPFASLAYHGGMTF